jgi:hypothetical protein
MFRRSVKFILLSALITQSHAFALSSLEPDISCTPQEKIADAGLGVSISREGSGYHYYFTRNSYAGPRSIADFPVVFRSKERNDERLELRVFQKAEQSLIYKFSFVSNGDGRDGKGWSIKTNGNAPDLRCEISEDIVDQYLNPLSTSNCHH